MTSIKRMTLALIPVLAIACSNRGQQGQTQPDAEEPALAAAAPETTVESMAGQWSVLRSPARTTPFVITLIIDSVAGTDVHGSVTRYFVGDMGTDPASFQPFTGTLVDSTLRIAVVQRGTGSDAIRMGGTVMGDSVALSEFRLAGANLTNQGMVWALVRSAR